MDSNTLGNETARAIGQGGKGQTTEGMHVMRGQSAGMTRGSVRGALTDKSFDGVSAVDMSAVDGGYREWYEGSWVSSLEACGVDASPADWIKYAQIVAELEANGGSKPGGGGGGGSGGGGGGAGGGKSAAAAPPPPSPPAPRLAPRPIVERRIGEEADDSGPVLQSNSVRGNSGRGRADGYVKLEEEGDTERGRLSAATKMNHGSSFFRARSPKGEKPRIGGRTESLESTFDEGDRAREKPPSMRGADFSYFTRPTPVPSSGAGGGAGGGGGGGGAASGSSGASAAVPKLGVPALGAVPALGVGAIATQQAREQDAMLADAELLDA